MSKCVRFERTPTQSVTWTQSNPLYDNRDTHDQSLYKGNRIVKELPIKTSNRFDILTSMGDLQNDDHHEITCDNFQTVFKGNKNKTGPTLGLLCHKKNPDVHVSKILEGNKNKTWKKLGDDTRDPYHDLSQTQKARSLFKGNKNGTRAKLGALPSHDNYDDVQMAEPIVTITSQHNHNTMVTNIEKVDACHELACMQDIDTDETHMLYDIANPGYKCRCNIPDVIHLNKHTSVDYQNCIQQNGRQFSFFAFE